jgi:hypothetical protein
MPRSPGGDGCMQLPASARSGGPLLHRIRPLIPTHRHGR